MDHLPAPQNSESLQLRVPYLGGAYDGGPFRTYLERQGTDIWSLLDRVRILSRPHVKCGGTSDAVDDDLGRSWHRMEVPRFVNIIHEMAKRKGNDVEDFVLHLENLAKRVETEKFNGNTLHTTIESNEDHARQDTTAIITIRDALHTLHGEIQIANQGGEMIAAEDKMDLYWKIVGVADDAQRFNALSSLDESMLEPSLEVKSWPARSNSDSMLEVLGKSKPWQSIQKTVQTWLYFGTLHQVFHTTGVAFEHQDFIEDGDIGQYATTKKLARYIDAWKLKERDVSEAREVRGREIMSNLQWTAKIAAEFERVVPSRSVGESINTFSILLLTYTLQQQASIIYGRGFVLSFTSAFLRRRFLASGWCPNQIATIEATYVLPWQYYIYLTGAASKRDDLAKRPHDHCTVSTCTVNQVSRETYRLRHVFNDDGVEFGDDCVICNIADGYRPSAPRKGFFDPDTKDLIRIVESGGIPLISVYNINLEDFNNDPKIVQYDPRKMRYVAISHVWADGFGNPYSNSMRLCQIMFLVKSLTQLGASVKGDEQRLYFWVDTICVPLEPASARIAAIQSISQVFAQAKSTLVMTNDLQRQDRPSTKLETLTRILVSNWTRRLWTYSEAMLSKRIAFKFAGEYVDFHETLQEMKEEAALMAPMWDFLGTLAGVHESVTVPWCRSNTIADVLKELPALDTVHTLNAAECLAELEALADTIAERYHQSQASNAPVQPLKVGRVSRLLEKMKSKETSIQTTIPRADAVEIPSQYTRALAFMSLVKGTPWKATSVPFDELICIAQLLRMNLVSILECSPDVDRGLRLLLQMQSVFPRNIIFIDAQHMKHDGFRWAPKSYLGNVIDQRDVDRLIITRDLALLSTQGLVLRWPGVILRTKSPLALGDSAEPFFFMLHGESEQPHGYEILIHSRKEVPPAKTHDDWTEIVLILDAQAGMPLPDHSITAGILAAALHHDRSSGIRHVQYITRVNVTRVDLASSSHPVWSPGSIGALDAKLEVVEVVPSRQAWCIS